MNRFTDRRQVRAGAVLLVVTGGAVGLLLVVGGLIHAGPPAEPLAGESLSLDFVTFSDRHGEAGQAYSMDSAAVPWVDAREWRFVVEYATDASTEHLEWFAVVETTLVDKRDRQVFVQSTTQSVHGEFPHGEFILDVASFIEEVEDVLLGMDSATSAFIRVTVLHTAALDLGDALVLSSTYARLTIVPEGETAWVWVENDEVVHPLATGVRWPEFLGMPLGAFAAGGALVGIARVHTSGQPK